MTLISAVFYYVVQIDVTDVGSKGSFTKDNGCRLVCPSAAPVGDKQFLLKVGRVLKLSFFYDY